MIARKAIRVLMPSLCQSGISLPALASSHNTAGRGDRARPPLSRQQPACPSQSSLTWSTSTPPTRSPPPVSEQSRSERVLRLPTVHANFNEEDFWATYRASRVSSSTADIAAALNTAAALEQARPLPMHPPGVVPNRPGQRLPPSASPAPPSPHEPILPHQLVHAFPPSRSALDTSRMQSTHPPPPWYTARMQYFPPPPPATAPPAPVHKVWILDCKSCGTFLTNRGMKVSVPSLPMCQRSPAIASLVECTFGRPALAHPGQQLLEYRASVDPCGRQHVIIDRGMRENHAPAYNYGHEAGAASLQIAAPRSRSSSSEVQVARRACLLRYLYLTPCTARAM
ncbi:hypothetical protein EVJ58_g3095 [Rhodofomes roseus]|uniref:Uncharacterized protein n=1 Tax=Rhodofomes roseus TaxID=34475 RepID=A0A4Y9YPM3_9APHY|nr:hypothetical protein EVJ58_g3095 [Rhodofomes roseus]